ncbi:MAG: bifunctional DNA-formamidopyrimidine glycosylase/DNA-(apurinic or apyrimidinic site) lyase [Methyloceanibacter sp.]|jgi:formamidopyrimidine-DNA glycosylase|nr:bifunctional DNA-formamidopyrimidine glycosylase/DNA-(apurinic or apyrimidinic site) lyase [Methyloceanibacter sp.]
MPELPEVETVRRGLEPFLVGNAFARVEQRRADLRFPLPSNFAKRLTGRKVEALDRRAKYLLARLDGGEVLVMHLGMTGRFSIDCPRRSKRPSRKRANTSQGFDDAPVAFGEFVPAQERPPKHEHIVFHLGDGTTLRYSDARRFGLMDLVPSDALEGHALFRDLGVEPLSSAFTPEWLAKRLKGKATSIKAALVDQKLVAGLGNIYACEALHRAGISPLRRAGTLATKSGKPTEKTRDLVASIKGVLADAIKAGGSSLRDYRRADGRLGRFQHRFKTYDREGRACPRKGCGGSVRRIVQAGRSTFYCPTCQR